MGKPFRFIAMCSLALVIFYLSLVSCSGEHYFSVQIPASDKAQAAADAVVLESKTSLRVDQVLVDYLQDLSSLADDGTVQVSLEQRLTDGLSAFADSHDAKLLSLSLKKTADTLSNEDRGVEGCQETPQPIVSEQHKGRNDMQLDLDYLISSKMPGFRYQATADGHGTLEFRYNLKTYAELQQLLGKDFQAFFDLGPTIPPSSWEEYKDFLQFIFEDYLGTRMLSPLLEQSRVTLTIEAPSPILEIEGGELIDPQTAQFSYELKDFLAPPMQLYARIAW